MIKRNLSRHRKDALLAMDALYRAQRYLNEAYVGWTLVLEHCCGISDALDGCRGLVGDLVDEDDVHKAVLFSLMLMGLSLTDVDPRCDPNMATKKQLMAIRRLGGAIFDGMTVTQASERISELEEAKRVLKRRDREKNHSGVQPGHKGGVQGKRQGIVEESPF